MADLVHDSFDRAILGALQRDGALTNAQLSEIVHLSPSQCSRRRAALEKSGAIRGYTARLDGRVLGFGMRAFAQNSQRFINQLPVYLGDRFYAFHFGAGFFQRSFHQFTQGLLRTGA